MTENGMVRVAARWHPFREDVAEWSVPEGLTLTEILSAAQRDPTLCGHAHVSINDCLIPQESWHLVRPKAGTVVSVRVVPAGGFAALFSSIAGALGFTGAVQTFVGGALSLTATYFLSKALAPTPPSFAASRESEPSYFVDHARNHSRPYRPIPAVFGRHKCVPPLGATTVTEVLGNHNYLTMVVVWGYGPLRISDLKIGETPITSFEDVTVETLQGRSTDAALTIYQDDIDESTFSIALTNANTGIPGDWSERRSADNADELSVDISLQRGLAQFDGAGARIEHTVQFDIQFRLVGNTAWLNPPLLTISGGRHVSGGTYELTGAETTPMRFGFRWSVLARGQYDVRMRRVSEDDDTSKMFSEIVWTVLRTITDEDPISFPKPLAMTALRIRGTDQLDGFVDTLSAVVESECLDWNGNAWVTAYSSNPASMFRLALQHPGRRVPAPNAEIDLDTLEDWHDFCDARGYSFDYVHETRKGLWDLLTEIAACGRASPQRVDGKWTVVVDTGTQPVRQHFTPLNSQGFTVSRPFDQKPHGVRLTFPNEDEGWSRDERIVYNDGYSDTNATNVPSLNPIGITDKDHIYRFGRFQLAQAVLRREQWTLTVGLEFLVAGRGSRVTCRHDVLVVGLASARVRRVHTNTGNQVTSVEIDAPVDLPDSAISYAAAVRTVDDADVTGQIVEAGGTGTPVSELTFMNPLTASIEIGALLSVGEHGSVTTDGLISEVEPQDDLTARLTIVPYQSGIYNAETGAIPSFDSGISGAVAIPAPVILSFTSTGAPVRRQGFGVSTAVLIEVRPIAYRNAVLEVQIRGSGSNSVYASAVVLERTNQTVVVGGIEQGRDYSIRLRWVVTDEEGNARVSAWTERAHTIAGITGLPGVIYETVYTITADNMLAVSKYPDNSWGYGEGGTADSQVWASDPQEVTEDNPFRWRAQRQIDALLDEGADVTAGWLAPVIDATLIGSQIWLTGTVDPANTLEETETFTSTP